MTPEMAEALAVLFDHSREAVQAGAVVFLRVGAVMAVLPGFGDQTVPLRVRLGLAVAFTLVVTPGASADAAALVQLPGGYLRALATEPLAGLLLGLGLRLMVMALQVAGTMAAQATSLAQFFGGAGVDPQPAISQLLLMGGVALAMAAGLHVQVAELLLMSYAMMPAGAFPPGWAVGEWGLAQVARAFALAFSLAAPFLIAAVVYNMALGAINRAMPQLMVAFVGAPALTLGGLVLLMVAAQPALTVWLAAFQALAADPFAPVP